MELPIPQQGVVDMPLLKKLLNWIRDPNQIKAQHQQNREFLDQTQSEFVDFKMYLTQSHPYLKFEPKHRWKKKEEGDAYVQ